MAYAQSKKSSPKAFTCPACLRNSHLPKILRCMHYICRECVHYQNTGTERTIACPLCDTEETVSSPLNKTENVGVLKQEKLNCGPCESDQNTTVAKFHCIDCEENLCEDCHTVHAKIKVSKHHTSVKLEENIDTSIIRRKKFCECCKEQAIREVEFFCKDHNTRCCGTCAIRAHKQCNVQDIAHLVERIKTESFVDDLRLALEESKNKIRSIVSTTKENNVDLEDKVEEIKSSVKNLRESINNLLDEFENKVITKSCKILEREMDKNNSQIKTCLKFTTAIEQSCSMFDEAVDNASDVDFHETYKHIESHSLKYVSFISKALEDRKFIELELTINDKITDILANGSVGDVHEKEQETHITPARKKSINRTKFVRAVTGQGGTIPRYSNAAYLFNGNICLIDCNNKRCCLFDSSFLNLDMVSLTSCPWTAACLDSNEVAITLPLEQKIQCYSVKQNKLQLSRWFLTQLPCWGIAPAGQSNIAVAVDCKGNSPGVGIISSVGDEILSLRADESELNFGAPWQFDFDIKRSRFLISCQSRDSVICMNTSGKVIFEYKAEKLRNPAGITHDRDGNVYVCGLKSHNIHQFTPNGDLMRIIALPKLRTPFSICYWKETDEFLVTTVENREELQLFSLT